MTFADSIRPSVRGESDKYSWRLYQRAQKRGRESVFIGPDELRPDEMPILTGPRPFVRSWRLMIGHRYEDSWFSGRRIGDVCLSGRERPDYNFAYGPGFGVSRWPDVTDWFWREYHRIGRCLFYRDIHGWININSSARKCAYCGLHQRRTVQTRRTIERVEVWG